jgi:hypothetical protein
MFANKRLALPKLTGDWGVDGPALVKALIERDLWLEKPNSIALSQAVIDASNDEVTLPTGTFVPGISFGGGVTGITYTTQVGSYTIAGDRVMVSGYIVLSSKGSSTGSVAITTLPFTCADSDNAVAPVALYLKGVTFANAFMGSVQKNSTQINLFEITEAGTVTNLADTDFANTSEVAFTAIYRRA